MERHAFAIRMADTICTMVEVRWSKTIHTVHGINLAFNVRKTYGTLCVGTFFLSLSFINLFEHLGSNTHAVSKRTLGMELTRFFYYTHQESKHNSSAACVISKLPRRRNLPLSQTHVYHIHLVEVQFHSIVKLTTGALLGAWELFWACAGKSCRSDIF